MWSLRTGNLNGGETGTKQTTLAIIRNQYRRIQKRATPVLPEVFTSKMFENVSDLPEAWDQLLPEEHPLRKNTLYIYEASELEDISYRYVMLFKKGEVAGLMSIQLLDFNHKHLGNLNGRHRITSWFLKCQQVKLLVCGNLFAQNQQGFYLADPADQISWIPILNDVAKNSGACGILIKDCQVPMIESAMKFQRFEPWGNDILMELYIDPRWESFEQYLAVLSRKYLQRAKKIMSSGMTVERRILNHNEVVYWQETIEKLYKQVAMRQPVRMGLLNRNYFRLMQEKSNQSFYITGYFLNDEMIGFKSTKLKGKNEEIHYIGFDQEANKKYNLYFNMLFDGLSEAILRKSEKLELGRTALDAKASLGAKPVSIRNYIQIRNPLAAWVFRSLSGKFEAESGDTWKNRNPFRNQ